MQRDPRNSNKRGKTEKLIQFKIANKAKQSSGNNKQLINQKWKATHAKLVVNEALGLKLNFITNI